MVTIHTPNFYEVSAKQGPQYFQGEWNPYPLDLEGVYSGRVSTDDIRVVVRSGTKEGDMIFGTWNVISRRFLDLLEECRASGFETFPVPLVKQGKLVAQYYGLRVHGRGGQFDPIRSDADYDGNTLNGHSAVFMNEKDWDRSDVFFIPGLGISLFVAERVAHYLKKAKLRNVQLTLNTDCRSGTKIDYVELRQRLMNKKRRTSK